jgi:hypothetical protein
MLAKRGKRLFIQSTKKIKLGNLLMGKPKTIEESKDEVKQ